MGQAELTPSLGSGAAVEEAKDANIPLGSAPDYLTSKQINTDWM